MFSGFSIGHIPYTPYSIKCFSSKPWVIQRTLKESFKEFAKKKNFNKNSCFRSGRLIRVFTENRKKYIFGIEIIFYRLKLPNCTLRRRSSVLS